jgi:hypothetical protein
MFPGQFALSTLLQSSRTQLTFPNLNSPSSTKLSETSTLAKCMFHSKLNTIILLLYRHLMLACIHPHHLVQHRLHKTSVPPLLSLPSLMMTVMLGMISLSNVCLLQVQTFLSHSYHFYSQKEACYSIIAAVNYSGQGYGFPNIHQCILITISDVVTGKTKHATLGNPVAIDADGLLMDVDVQLVDNNPSSHEDKCQDVDHFFCPAIVKDVNGKSKKYHAYKSCP